MRFGAWPATSRAVLRGRLIPVGTEADPSTKVDKEEKFEVTPVGSGNKESRRSVCLYKIDRTPQL